MDALANMAVHFLDRHLAEGREDKPAIRCEDRTLSYREVAELADRCGQGLRALGLCPGERVLLILPDAPEFAAGYFGAIKAGLVAVPTSTALQAADWARLLDESQAAALIADAPAWAALAPLAAARRHLRHAIVRGGDLVPGTTRWDDWIAAQPARLDPAPVDAATPAFWLWTSGSTGQPKAAVHRHGDWRASAECYASGVLALTERDVTFSSSKLFHAYGLGNGLMFPFHAGATTVLHPHRPTARTILERAQAERPTLFFSVPTLYAAMLAETDGGARFDLASVRHGISAAEPLPAEIFRRWRDRFGFEILDGIGSTEVLHIYISARPGQVKPGSTGLPVPGYELAIGEEGELAVRGATLMSGYWSRPDLTAERLSDGWFRTGDRYRRDEDGHYWYAGRLDDMMKVGGQWLSPIEVESRLIEHPAVLESAVVPFIDANGLTKPRAFVVLKPGFAAGEALSEELAAFVRAALAPYKAPRRIRFVDALPKTAAGKIQRYLLRREA